MLSSLERILSEMSEDRLKDIELRAQELMKERERTKNTVFKLGEYILTEDLKFSNAHGVGTIPKGVIFLVTQLDEKSNKFYSGSFGDWHYNQLPCLYLGDD